MSKRNIKPSVKRVDVPVEPDIADSFCEYVSQQVPNVTPQDLEAIRMGIRREYGGERHYVRQLDTVERARHTKRCAEVLAQHFNGRNASELARKLGISRVTVWRLLKQPGRAK